MLSVSSVVNLNLIPSGKKNLTTELTESTEIAMAASNNDSESSRSVELLSPSD